MNGTMLSQVVCPTGVHRTDVCATDVRPTDVRPTEWRGKGPQREPFCECLPKVAKNCQKKQKVELTTFWCYNSVATKGHPLPLVNYKRVVQNSGIDIMGFFIRATTPEN